MFVRIRGLKALAIGVAFVVVTPSVFAENKCKTGYEECRQHSLDPDDLAHKEAGVQIGASYCKQIGLNRKACRDERDLAIAYTAMAAWCGTACVLQYTVYGSEAAQAMKPYCYYGTSLVSLGEIFITKILTDEAKAYSDAEVKKLSTDFGFTDPYMKGILAGWGIFAGAAPAIFMAAKPGSTLESASAKAYSSKAALCLTAAVNGVFATMKWINRSHIIDSSVSNLESAQGIWSPKSETPGSGSSHNQSFLSGGGGSSPPPIADTRSPTAEVGDKDDKVDTARIGESYAMADSSKLFGNPKAEDFKKMMDQFGKRGVTLDGIANSLESGGVGATISKMIGSDSEFAKKMGDVFKDIDSKLAGMPAGGLAFEKMGGASGGSGKSGGNGLGDLSGLFGARGPAGDGAGGVKDIKFGGFESDIWHAGSTLSIFEIVSRKTQTVSTRVGR